jgi:hypothetical protein
MATRFTLLCALAATLTLSASAHAQETSAPSLSAPDVRQPQGTAPDGPACGMASAQHRVYADAPGDSRTAPDLGSISVDVREDCGVTVTFAALTLAPGQSLTVGIDTDSNGGTGLRDQAGADRILSVRDGQATLGIVDPATGSVASYVSPAPVVRAGETTAVDTRVDALGLLPGRAARLTFSSAGTDMDADFAPEASSAGFDLLVDFGNVAGATETSAPARAILKGRAKVGRTLSCAAPAGMKKPSYRWLRAGRAIAGANNRTLKLRKADGGRRVSCRVTGTLAGEHATITSAAATIQRK